MTEFIEAPDHIWFVTFYPGNDDEFVLPLRGWEFDKVGAVGHPCVPDPCDAYETDVVRAERIAADFDWPHYDAGSSVVLLDSGQVFVSGRDVRDNDEPPEVEQEPPNVDPGLRNAA